MRLYGLATHIDDGIYMIVEYSTDLKKLTKTSDTIYFTDDDRGFTTNIANTREWDTDANHLIGWYPYNGEVTIKDQYKIGDEYYDLYGDEFPKEYMVNGKPNDEKLDEECPVGDLTITFKNGEIVNKTFKEHNDYYTK